METSNNIMCPVCTLFLRPGITLKQHLTSHPKQKVIEALVKLAEGGDEPEKISSTPSHSRHATQSTSNNAEPPQQNGSSIPTMPPQFNPLQMGNMGVPQNMGQLGQFPGNHFFIYQQSMSTTNQPNVLNVNQPYLVPAPTASAFFANTQQMMPYIYQQQQVIMAGNTSIGPHLNRALPFEMPNCSMQSQLNHLSSFDVTEEPHLISESDSEDIKPVLNNRKTTKNISEIKEVLNDSSADTEDQRITEVIESESDSVSIVSIKSGGQIQNKSPGRSEPVQSVIVMDVSEECHEEQEPEHSEEEEQQPEEEYHLVDLKHPIKQQQKVEITAADIGNPEDDETGSREREQSMQGAFPHHHQEQFEASSEANQSIDHEEYVHMTVMSAPLSPTDSDWGLNEDIHQELDKACQTQGHAQTGHHESPRSVHSIHSSVHEEMLEEEEEEANNLELSEPPNDEPDYFYMNESHQNSSESVVVTTHNSIIRSVAHAHHGYEQSEPIYTSTNILHGGEPVDFVTMEDLDGMQVIIGEFHGTPAISQVEDFEHMDSDRPRVLMTIGEINHSKNNHSSSSIPSQDHEDNSVPNLNMQSDEKMPARGELSGQESLGSASNISWHHATYQHHQEVTHDSYDHVWADDSNGAQGTLGIDGESDNHTDHIIDMKFQPPTHEVVSLPEDFKKAEDEMPQDIDVKPKLIGLDIDRKKTKKLVIKPKKPKIKPANSFNDVFTKFKVERCETEVTVGRVAISETEVSPETRDLLLDIKPSGSMPKITCQMCNETFRTKKLLRLHAIEQHNIADTKLSCAICQQTFLNDYKFTEHLKIHPLECKICARLFYRRQNLNLHMNRHLGIKPYQCDVCDKAFITKQKMDEHRNIHSGNAPFKCHMCDEAFKRYSNLVQHRNRHHFHIKKKLKDYVCFCGEVYHSKKKLAWHQETHDQKPKSCPHCSEKFIHQASLSRHMRHAHNVDHSPQKAIGICPICKGTFLKTSLDAHIKNHSGQKPFTCLICNKEFTTKWNLKLHKWTHTSRTQKPYKCEMCKSAFIRNTDYIAHMNSHKNIRPYTCNYCGAQFIRKYNCQRHVKEHENDKTYNCNVCGKSFHRSYYLKDHMRVHSGIRPYACHICGKTSTTKSNHNKHIQIHHAREPVSTEN